MSLKDFTMMRCAMNARIDIPTRKIIAFCEKWEIAELSLFGSVLRDDFRFDSDVDVLVNFMEHADWSLFDWIDMRDELIAIFGRGVDLISKKGLRNPYRRREILRTCEVVYAA